MRFSDTLKLVTRNLRRRRGRTILTAIELLAYCKG